MDNLGEERFFVRNYRTVRVGFLDRSWGGRCTFVTVQEIATLLVKDKLASLRYSDEIKGGKLPPAASWVSVTKTRHGQQGTGYL